MNDVFHQGEMDEKYESLHEKYLLLKAALRDIREMAINIQECPSGDTPEKTEDIILEMDGFVSDIIEICEENSEL